MILLITIVLIVLFATSLSNINNYVIANIAAALILSTLDRITGGLPFTFGMIKIPLFAIGYIFHMLRASKINFNKSVKTLLILWVIFFVGLYIKSLFLDSESNLYLFHFSGLVFLPLITVPLIKSFNAERVIYILLNFIFLPTAIFGIIQFALGPDFFESIGFHIITDNTLTAYSDTFLSNQTDAYFGIRPFSFLTTSAGFGVMMFHACLWVVVLNPNQKKLILNKYLIYFLFFTALLVAQFMTSILLTIACIAIYIYKSSEGRQKFKYLFIALIIILFLGVFLKLFIPAVFDRIYYTFHFLTPTGHQNSLASRFKFLLNYPDLIREFFFVGVNNRSAIIGFSADSKFLYLILLTGFPIAFMYLNILMKITSNGMKAVKLSVHSHFYNKLGFITYLTFGAIIINDLSNGHIESTTPSNLIIWIIAGISLSVLTTKNNHFSNKIKPID